MMASGLNVILRPLFVLTKNNILIAGLSYALTISLANYLGPTEFGLYSLTLLIASLLSIIINFGTEQTASVNFSKNKNADLILHRVLFIRFTIVGVCLIPITFIYQNDLLILFFIFSILLSNFNLAFYYEITRDNERYSYIYLCERLIYILAAFALIFTGTLNLTWVFILLGVVTTLSYIFQYRDASVYKIIKGTKENVFTIELLAQNFPLMVVGLSMFAFGGFSRLILEQKLGQTSLGIYSAGWQLIAIGTIFQSQVGRIWRIRISETVVAGDLKSLLNEFKMYLVFVICPMLILSLVFWRYSDLIVATIFSVEFIELRDLIPSFGIYLVVISLSGLVDMLWIAVEKNTSFMTIKIIFSCILLLFLWGFSNGFGMLEFVNLTIGVHFCSVVALFLIWLFKFRKRLN